MKDSMPVPVSRNNLKFLAARKERDGSFQWLVRSVRLNAIERCAIVDSLPSPQAGERSPRSLVCVVRAWPAVRPCQVLRHFT